MAVPGILRLDPFYFCLQMWLILCKKRKLKTCKKLSLIKITQEVGSYNHQSYEIYLWYLFNIAVLRISKYLNTSLSCLALHMEGPLKCWIWFTVSTISVLNTPLTQWIFRFIYFSYMFDSNAASGRLLVETLTKYRNRNIYMIGMFCIVLLTCIKMNRNSSSTHISYVFALLNLQVSIFKFCEDQHYLTQMLFVNIVFRTI